ncbi:MAG: 30S ribosomal protein S16 [Demequinaceae bacterium]|nr:30S ribosomal protein S16 [Demequinaceae bacterium]
MAVKIRLKRFGKKHSPFYRVVVMDSRTKRDGRAIEEIGKYHPMENPSVVEIDSARALYWLGVGAQPSEQVTALLKLTGDWQTFKGEKGATNTVKPQQPKVSAEDRIKEAAKSAERAKAAKAAEREKAAKQAADEAKKAAEEKKAAEDVVADESREVPTDEGAEVDVEIAEGDPSDAGDKVEGIIDEAKAEG